MTPQTSGLLLASVAALAVTPAFAQTTAAPPEATVTAANALDAAGVGDIVVTATRRVQSIQDVPISIEVVSGKKLDDFHANDFKAIMNYVPNVFVESTAGDDVIYIRGFGSPPANFSFDQSVSLYVDGIYAGRARQAQAPFFDLERVEVLRGPQGALFGKNTPAGAINIISAGPTKEFSGAATGLYNFDHEGYDISGFVSVPITETFGARLAVKFLDQDGYIRNNFNGRNDPQQREQLARLTLRFAPSSMFDYTGKVEYGNRDVIGGVTVSSSLTGPQNPQTFRFIEDSPLGREGTSTESLIVSGIGNLRFGDYTLTSVTGYSQFDATTVNDFDQSLPGGGVTLNTVYNSFPQEFQQYSQEFRLQSPVDRPLEYIVGVYYDYSKYKLTQLGGFNIPALRYFGLLQTNFRQTAESVSVFGQATYRILDSLRLIGSLRYTITDKSADFSGRLVYGPFPLRPLTSAQGQRSEDNIDPSATVQYDINPDIMVYATYGEGSKSGGFVSNTYGTTSATFAYLPERSRNYEIGVKSSFFDKTLIVNVSLYDTQFQNLQVSVYNSTTTSFVTGNAASATSRGIEGSIVWNPVPNFDVTASGAYQDVKYDDYPGAGCLASQPITECNPANPASVAANNLKGFTLPYTSKYTGNVQVHYRLDLGEKYKLDTTVIVAGRSKYFNSDNQSPIFGVQKGYAKVDLRVQFADRNDRWRVAFVGRNLTNELTTGSAFALPAPITPVPRAILYLEPTRNLAIEAGVRF